MTGKTITRGAIYHHGSRRRREVAITQELRDKVKETVNAIRAMMDSGKLPPPVNDARCKECSLKKIRQPDVLAERHRLKSLCEELFKGTSKNPILRAAALRLACLNRFITIRRYSKKTIAYISTICSALIFYSCLVLLRNLDF